MKKILIASVLGAALLASCNQASVSGKTKTTNFALRTVPAGVVGYDKSAGTAAVTDLSSKDTVTVLTATGLKAGVAYVAHYHAQGTGDNATKPACDSNGAIVDGMIGGMSFTADTNGAVAIKGLNTTSAISTGKYINIHEAAALGVVPLCADLTK